MKKIVFKTTLVSLCLSSSLLMTAQTKKEVKETLVVKPIAETPATTTINNEPKPSTHGHILIKEIPAYKPVISVTETNQDVAKGGIRGTDVIGEGEYLNYNKTIMQKSITGQIPVGFPKHIKGQTPQQYKDVIMVWARNNKHLIKEEYHHEIK